MARTVNPTEHAARRRAIIDAAKLCFARKGFHQTSTAEICAAAKTSSGSLFHYFPSKKAIIVAIVEQEREETARYLADLSHRSDLYAALRGFIDLILTLAADRDFSSLALEIAAEAARDADIRSLTSRSDAELHNALKRLLAEASKRGQIDPAINVASASQCIAVMIDGIFSRIATDPTFNPAKHRDTFLIMLGRFLRPDAKA